MSDEIDVGHVVHAPTGTVTVVLGDIAGSTRLWQQDPAAMELASRRVRDLLRELADENRGHLPREQGEGDNVVAAFAVASDAVAFALGMDRAFSAETWMGGLNIAMRIGLHTGDVSWDEDSGYLGPTFNRCARLRDLGHARQILLSQATRDIIADGLGAELRLDDLGSHQLRDLSRAEHVFQLRWRDDDTVWAPLKSVSSLPNNLPVPVTSLIGREEEIVHVAQLLIDNRLVTLTGAGGSGKTRLAQHVASEALQYAPNGAWWVDLMPIAEDDQVASTMAEAARLLDVTTGEQLADAIGESGMLLVIDNCEHLIDMVADIVELLVKRCRNLRILATSRETIGIDGEQNVRVRPLAEPEAAALFRDRAEAVAPLSGAADDAQAIDEICRRLDGIPLAIELAAARTGVLTPRQIADGLDDRFRLLTSGARRARSRQRTLEASVAWSYDLLDDDEQAVLCRLGVHPAAFTLEGATHVGGLGSNDPALLDILSSLVEKSLVTVRPDDNGRRYRLLETIKQYALDRLTERGEAEAARGAHLDFVLDVMRDLEDRLVERLNDPTAWVAGRSWLDDVRTAQSWAALSDRSTDIIQLHWPMYAVALITTNHGDTVEALEPLLDLELDLQARTRVLAMLIAFKGAMTDFTGAAALTDEAVRLARELDDDLTLAGLLASSGLARAFASGDGEVFAAEAMERSRAYGPAMIAIAGYCLGIAAVWGVTPPEVHLQAIKEGLHAAMTARLAPLAVTCGSLLAGQQMGMGDFAAGLEQSEATIDFAGRAAPRAMAGHTFISGVWARLWGARHDEAIELGEQSIAAAGPPGTVSHHLALLTRVTANVALEREAHQVMQDTDQVLAWLRGSGADFYLVLTLGLRAQACLQLGDDRQAQRLLDEAEPLIPERGWIYPRGWVALGRVRMPGVTPEQVCAEAARQLVHLSGPGWLAGWGQAFLAASAEALVTMDRHEDAASLIGCATAMTDRLDLPEAGWMIGATPEHFDAVRTGMESATWEVGFARGRSMDMVDAAALLRGEGSSTASASSVERPVIGWGSLTPAEVDVAVKVAEGLTNPEVAEALFVSTNTVKTHLKNIYAKLDIGSRAALATAVAEHAGAGA